MGELKLFIQRRLMHILDCLWRCIKFQFLKTTRHLGVAPYRRQYMVEKYDRLPPTFDSRNSDVQSKTAIWWSPVAVRLCCASCRGYDHDLCIKHDDARWYTRKCTRCLKDAHSGGSLFQI